ncbi:hypothetical protein AA14337_3261 [Acetobacter malorum DSM 14337]|uniref:Uncharacterized protein n=1 Tax=Acetobacter malorum DSM 14337 TaxID=1307910 RepID=A0ABQ0Q0J1_9PROT|nr:hypothetical protein [Acetobacter malorum]KXV09883.1 hypothetical protein AD930_02340 [Acetobacter malorum]GBQ86182.1 hypothetical protein AA14337_3261 [Acetobacter malorum DSM 14337]
MIEKLANERGKTADRVRQALKDLHITTPVMALVSHMSMAPGIPKEVNAEWLRKKWQSEVIYHSEGHIDLGGIPSDIAFQNWATEKLNNPRGLLRKSISMARKEVRHDHLSYFIMTRWDQENACAERMRDSDDARTSLMASLWLSKSLLEQSRYLIEAIILYSGRISRNGIERITPGWLKCDPDEIRCWDTIPVDCAPIWLDHATEQFGAVLDNMRTSIIQKAAIQARETQKNEVRFLRLRNQSDRVAIMQFHQMSGPLEEAAMLGINANEFTLAHRMMTDAILDGTCDIAQAVEIPVWRIFADFLPLAKNKLPRPTENEVSIRLNNLFSLNAIEFLEQRSTILKRMGVSFSEAQQILSDWSVTVANYAQNTEDWHMIPGNPEVGFFIYVSSRNRG